MKRHKHRGFTLIELLVVVSIIALLVSILLPALAEARRQGKLAVDSSNLRQIGLSLNMYANENDNWYPRCAIGNALFDVAYSTTNYIIATGGDKETFYCPLEGIKNPDEDIFWRACECWNTGHRDMGNTPEPPSILREYGNTGIFVDDLDRIFRVTGYLWLFDLAEEFKEIPGFENYRPSPFLGFPPRKWVTRSTQRDPADTEFVVDITISVGTNPDTAQWNHIHWGLWNSWQVEDKTAHLDKKQEKPRDGFCLYVDGHVARNEFDDMVRRYYCGVHHWW